MILSIKADETVFAFLNALTLGWLGISNRLNEAFFTAKQYIKEIKTDVSFGDLFAGNALYSTSCHVFDYGIYPFVLKYLGLFLGGIVMTFFSAGISFFFALKYKKDWLGIILVRNARDKLYEKLGLGQSSILEKVEGAVEFIVISIKTDPFITTIYFSKNGGRFSPQKWRIFLSSVLVSNAAWIFGIEVVLVGVETFFRTVEARAYALMLFQTYLVYKGAAKVAPYSFTFNIKF